MPIPHSSARLASPRATAALVATVVLLTAIAPLAYGYNPALKTSMSDHDPARARALLDLYGYVDRDGVHCCGPSDCRREHATKFRETPAGIEIVTGAGDRAAAMVAAHASEAAENAIG